MIDGSVCQLFHVTMHREHGCLEMFGEWTLARRRVPFKGICQGRPSMPIFEPLEEMYKAEAGRKRREDVRVLDKAVLRYRLMEATKGLVHQS